MKILFFINQFAGGGRERRMVELVKGLDKVKDVKMHCVVFHNRVDYTDVLSTGMTVESINEPSRLKRFKAIECIIKSYRPDIVHSWVDTPTEMICLGYLKGKYHYRYIAGFVADGNNENLMSLRNICMRYTFRKAEAIVSNSKAGLLAKKAPSGKSFVIYNGFDFNRIPQDVNIEDQRKKLGVDTQFLAVMCARVNKAKDWQSYIDLARLCQKNGVDITFLALGEGNMLSYYQNLTRYPQSNIHFIGRRNDVEEILAASDFSFLFTNSHLHAEGVSNSILESMAVGIPVVATKGGGTTEIVDSGYNGFLVDEFDSRTAYTRLVQLINDDKLRHMFTKNAIDTVKAKFDLSKMTADYFALYKRLLSPIS